MCNYLSIITIVCVCALKEWYLQRSGLCLKLYLNADWSNSFGASFKWANYYGSSFKAIIWFYIIGEPSCLFCKQKLLLRIVFILDPGVSVQHIVYLVLSAMALLLMSHLLHLTEFLPFVAKTLPILCLSKLWRIMETYILLHPICMCIVCVSKKNIYCERKKSGPFNKMQVCIMHNPRDWFYSIMQYYFNV